MPIGIPYTKDLIDEYVSKIDGIIIPGGDFALIPEWYVKGEESPFPASPRLQFDISIIEKSLQKEIPLLGICAGMQILSGMFGCKLSAKIQSHSNSKLDHLKNKPAEEYAHTVNVTKGSLLEKITGAAKIRTNSRHTEGVVWANDRMAVSGVSEDGIIEAVEVKGVPFALGLQWHPEYFLKEGDADFEIFKALVKHASK